MTAGFTALVLAGSRGGADAVADYAGVSHKALIVLDGRTLIHRVLDALDAAGAARIIVSTHDAGVAAELARIKTRAAVTRIDAAASPSASVLEAAEKVGTPLLVTTADHALLQPEWVTRFLDDAPQGADIAVLLASEAVVTAAARTKRTYLAFADGRYSGCNLFLLRNPQALNAIAFWRRVEAQRKAPWKMALTVGPIMLVRYALKMLTLDGMIAQLGRRAGATAAAVRSPFGLAAVDVDKPSDLDLVRKLVETA